MSDNGTSAVKLAAAHPSCFLILMVMVMIMITMILMMILVMKSLIMMKILKTNFDQCKQLKMDLGSVYDRKVTPSPLRDEYYDDIDGAEVIVEYLGVDSFNLNSAS